MSRSGYVEDTDDQWELIRWRGAVKAAIKGKRGQALLREMLTALDAIPDKRLIEEELKAPGGGDVCALGAVGLRRNMDLDAIDPGDYEQVARAFGIAESLAREIMYENDEGGWRETPEQRWARMRTWVMAQLVED